MKPTKRTRPAPLTTKQTRKARVRAAFEGRPKPTAAGAAGAEFYGVRVDAPAPAPALEPGPSVVDGPPTLSGKKTKPKK